MNRAAGALLAGLAGVGLLVLGRVTAPAQDAAPPRPATSRELAAAPLACGFTGPTIARLDDRDLARLRDEVVAAMADRTAQPAPIAAEPEAAAPPSPAALAAADAIDQRLDTALAAGQWTSADARAFRAALVELTPAARDAAMARLVTSINAQTLRLEPGVAPM